MEPRVKNPVLHLTIYTLATFPTFYHQEHNVLTTFPKLYDFYKLSETKLPENHIRPPGEHIPKDI